MLHLIDGDMDVWQNQKRHQHPWIFNACLALLLDFATVSCFNLSAPVLGWVYPIAACGSQKGSGASWFSYRSDLSLNFWLNSDMKQTKRHMGFLCKFALELQPVKISPAITNWMWRTNGVIPAYINSRACVSKVQLIGISLSVAWPQSLLLCCAESLSCLLPFFCSNLNVFNVWNWLQIMAFTWVHLVFSSSEKGISNVLYTQL